MKQILLIIFCVGFLLIQQSFAQSHTVTGTVTGKDDGLPVAGVTVTIKGTTIGVATDGAGKYRINVPNGGALIFSEIGYLSQQLIVQGEVLNVSFVLANTQLNEIVVTANDIKREKRTLGYSAPTVSNKELTEGGNPSALTSLTGLIAGVNITSASNAPGASTRIVLRGGSSITGNNQALLVVDGVPIDN